MGVGISLSIANHPVGEHHFVPLQPAKQNKFDNSFTHCTNATQETTLEFGSGFSLLIYSKNVNKFVCNMFMALVASLASITQLMLISLAPVVSNQYIAL